MHRRDFKLWEDELLQFGVVNPFPPTLSKSTIKLIHTSTKIVAGGLAASVILGCVSAATKEAPHRTADAAAFQYFYSNDGGITAKIPTPDASNGNETMYVNFICGPDGSLEVDNTSTHLEGIFDKDVITKLISLDVIDRNPCDNGLTLDDTHTLGLAAVKNGFATYVTAPPQG